MPKCQQLNLLIIASFFLIYSGKDFDLLADKTKFQQKSLEDIKQQVLGGLIENVVYYQHKNHARKSNNSSFSKAHAVHQSVIAKTPGIHKARGIFSMVDLPSSANKQSRWLKKNDGPDQADKQAYCKVCLKSYRAHHGDLMKHAENKTHKNCMDRLNSTVQPKIKFTVQKDSSGRREDCKLSMFVACHTSIKSVDHLSKLLTNLNFKVNLARTKCTSIIKNVLEPCLLENLINDIGDSNFSLIVDESTDISNFKYLCMCVRYFSATECQILTDFLCLIPIDKADHKTLFNHVNTFFEKVGLQLKNVIGLGTDGGSNLCGKNNSLFTMIKEHAQNLQLVRCVCHALNLAASKAADQFPSAVEFIIHEIYNWFSQSPLRQSEYKQLFDLLNLVDEGFQEQGKTFHKFVKLSGTRWLARYHAVKIIRQQYFELLRYFSDIVEKEEKSYKARLLLSMLKDRSNYLYLIFIEPILLEINSLNLSFQREIVKVNVAYDDLKDLILLVANKIVKVDFLMDFDCLSKIFDTKSNDHFFKSVIDCNLGIDFEFALLEQKLHIEEEKKNEIATNAFNYLKVLLKQLISRLPENMHHFSRVKKLSTDVCLSLTIRDDFKNLPFIDVFINKKELSLVENQYLKLVTVEWKSFMTNEQLNDSFKFWAQVFNFKNAGGDYAFRELAKYALNVLSLPTSNAVVERCFSVMNATKTKSRNRMQVELLNAILRIKINNFARKKCCDTFEPTADMLARCTSRNLYPFQYEGTEDIINLHLEDLDVEDSTILDQFFPTSHVL